MHRKWVGLQYICNKSKKLAHNIKKKLQSNIKNLYMGNMRSVQ